MPIPPPGGLLDEVGGLDEVPVDVLVPVDMLEGLPLDVGGLVDVGLVDVGLVVGAAEDDAGELAAGAPGEAQACWAA